jgi:hypothetical protein
MSKPLQQVLDEHLLPFTLRPDQFESVEELKDYPRAGLYCDVGTGKTVMATCLTLCWDADVNVIIMPPILLKQWHRWLTSIGNIGDILIYRGTLKERKAMDITKFKWVMMSIGILKNDYKRIHDALAPKTKTVLVDEATSIKNPSSGNHKAVASLAEDSNLSLLTGTPLSTPHDAYAYVKLITPGTYRSKTQFDNIHVAERDFFEKVTQWKNLDLMQSNLMLHSVRLLKENVLKNLKQPNYIPIEYELEKEHMALYKVLAEEQILLLETGGKIDATSASKLYNALQQIIVNWDHFSGNEDARSTTFDLIDHVMDSAAVMNPKNSKLIICSYYRITSAKILQYLQEFGAVGIYGDVSAKQQEINSERFAFDPTCRILVMQPMSGGFGSNYQHVCSEVLFAEAPRMPLHFNQVVGRVYRDGQPNVPNIHIGIASGTIQKHLFENLLHNDQLLNRVQGGFQDLRDAVYGK